MLKRTAAHPILQLDADLKLFLESDAFNVDIKHKEKQTTTPSENKGMFGSLGFGGGLTGKFVENDEVGIIKALVTGITFLFLMRVVFP